MQVKTIKVTGDNLGELIEFDKDGRPYINYRKLWNLLRTPD